MMIRGDFFFFSAWENQPYETLEDLYNESFGGKI